MPRHVTADRREIGGGRRRLVHDLAVGDDKQPVRQLQQLVEILADQQHGCAAVARGGWLNGAAFRSAARELIARYRVKTSSPEAPIATLSGGNVQRAVLARELAGDINVLIAANPVFGLDFAAVAEIHARILQVRAKGGAVLLISEDLDELLELSDRIAVMSEGRVVFETPAATADRRVIGAHMGGGDHGDHGESPLAEAA